jgi:hypothetical protein
MHMLRVVGVGEDMFKVKDLHYFGGPQFSHYLMKLNDSKVH